MPFHGPPGDPHNQQGQGPDPLAGLLDMILPAIGSAIYAWNYNTQPIRDYYNPVLGVARDVATPGSRSRQTLGRAAEGFSRDAGSFVRQLGDLGQRATTGFQSAVTTAFDTAQGRMPYLIPEALRPRFNPVGSPQTRQQPFAQEREGLARAGESIRQTGRTVSSYLGDLAMAIPNFEAGVVEDLFQRSPRQYTKRRRGQ